MNHKLWLGIWKFLKYRKKYIRWIVYFSLNQGGVFLIKNLGETKPKKRTVYSVRH